VSRTTTATIEIDADRTCGRAVALLARISRLAPDDGAVASSARCSATIASTTDMRQCMPTSAAVQKSVVESTCNGENYIHQGRRPGRLDQLAPAMPRVAHHAQAKHRVRLPAAGR
jgi:hypothetical protein